MLRMRSNRNIGTDAGAAAQELFGEDVFLLLVAEILIGEDDSFCKSETFFSDLVVLQFLIPHF